MDKLQTIAFIREQVAEGKISKEELLEIVKGSDAASFHLKEESSKNLINVFYAIGAIIAVIGVIILVADNWDQIGFVGRVLVTLGISFAAYVSGLVFRAPEQDKLSQVMFTISAALAPLGTYVFLDEAGVDFTSGIQISAALVLSVIFGAALYISRKAILTLITIGFATWAYYALTIELFDTSYYGYDIDFLKWATMLLGVSYLLIAYGHRRSVPVQNILYGFGTLAILGAGISIGGFFDLLFIAFIFAAFYGSVYLKSRAMLALGALFLMAHIIKLTSEYFVDSIGWPVALIAVGFLVIGIGYGTFYLNKKYIAVK